MKNKERRIKNSLWAFLGIFLLMGVFPVSAQQYTGMSGLIHVPSADMDDAGAARVGIHFLNKNSHRTVFLIKTVNIIPLATI